MAIDKSAQVRVIGNMRLTWVLVVDNTADSKDIGCAGHKNRGAVRHTQVDYMAACAVARSSIVEVGVDVEGVCSIHMHLAEIVVLRRALVRMTDVYKQGHVEILAVQHQLRPHLGAEFSEHLRELRMALRTWRPVKRLVTPACPVSTQLAMVRLPLAPNHL